MTEALTDFIKYVIPSILTLVGVIVTVRKSHADTKKKIEEQSDLTIYRINQLEKKQDKYNNLQGRMYEAEQGIKINAEKINAANKRIENLENHSA